MIDSVNTGKLLIQVKAITLKYSKKNVNMFLKKKRCLNRLIATQKYLLIKKILIIKCSEEDSVEKNSND